MKEKMKIKENERMEERRERDKVRGIKITN